MAKQIKQWITVNHIHIPIFEGESKADAVKRIKEGVRKGRENTPKTKKVKEDREKEYDKAVKAEKHALRRWQNSESGEAEEKNWESVKKTRVRKEKASKALEDSGHRRTIEKHSFNKKSVPKKEDFVVGNNPPTEKEQAWMNAKAIHISKYMPKEKQAELRKLKKQYEKQYKNNSPISKELHEEKTHNLENTGVEYLNAIHNSNKKDPFHEDENVRQKYEEHDKATKEYRKVSDRTVYNSIHVNKKAVKPEAKSPSLDNITDAKNQAELNSKLKERGLSLDSAYQKAHSDDRVTMYDKDGNSYTGTYNQYNDGGREIVNIRKEKSWQDKDAEVKAKQIANAEKQKAERNGEPKLEYDLGGNLLGKDGKLAKNMSKQELEDWQKEVERKSERNGKNITIDNLKNGAQKVNGYNIEVGKNEDGSLGKRTAVWTDDFKTQKYFNSPEKALEFVC